MACRLIEWQGPAGTDERTNYLEKKFLVYLIYVEDIKVEIENNRL